MAVRPVTARLTRITFGGPELEGLSPGLPGGSLRLLVPPPAGAPLVVPRWTGNEYLLPDGSRPPIRTLTPLRVDSAALELDVEVVRHGDGPLSRWAGAAQPGQQTVLSGLGRGYEVDATADHFLLAGDESAVPAVTTLLPELPATAEVEVLVELADPEDRPPLPTARAVRWLAPSPGGPPGDALVAAVVAAELARDVRVWAAGEAAAMQRIRRHLFVERHLPRPQAVVRGYWKHGRSGDAGDKGDAGEG